MQRTQLENAYMFRSIFDTTPDPINLNRLDNGKFVLVNEKFLELTGYKKNEVIGKTALDIKIWNDQSRRDQFFRLLLDEERVNDFEAEFRRKDGRILIALVSAIIIPYQNIPHLLAVTKDITELKHAQQELLVANKKLGKKYKDSSRKLKESELKYSVLIDALLTGVYICEGEKIVFANKQFCKMFGYGKKELLDLDMLDLIHPDDRNEFNTFCNLPPPTGSMESAYEIRGVRKNGDIIYLSGRNTVIESNGRKAILGNVSNITSKKMFEHKLRRSEEAMRSLSAQLISAEERERKRIARDIHDSIGQALSAINFSVENALNAIQEKSFPLAAEALENILPLTRQSIEEVRRIIMDLRPSILDDLGLTATISWLYREFESIFPHIHFEKRIDVEEADIPPSLKTVIYRILQEAFNNAVKHSKTNFIGLHLRKRMNHLELQIEDKGQGFDLNKEQSKTMNDKGMGLASMKERTQLSGGTFKILATPGKGTRIFLSWPLESMGGRKRRQKV